MNCQEKKSLIAGIQIQLQATTSLGVENFNIWRVITEAFGFCIIVSFKLKHLINLSKMFLLFSIGLNVEKDSVVFPSCIDSRDHSIGSRVQYGQSSVAILLTTFLVANSSPCLCRKGLSLCGATLSHGEFLLSEKHLRIGVHRRGRVSCPPKTSVRMQVNIEF